jgi:spoIIIJ-associated protein
MQDQELDRSEPGRSVVQEGKNVEDAISKGAEHLGVSRDQVEYEVLEQGSSGVFGLIGVKQAKVVVRTKAEAEAEPEAEDGEVSAKIEEMVAEIMRLMGIKAQVKIEIEEGVHRVSIETAGSDGLLIGKKGESLEDIGHLLRRMVGKQLKKSVRMDVDVGGYKKRRGSALRSKAVSLASRVKSTGREMQMEPLPSAERRVIHLALADDPQVKTYTIGEGDLKTVVISPGRGGRSSAGGGRRDPEALGGDGVDEEGYGGE